MKTLLLFLGFCVVFAAGFATDRLLSGAIMINVGYIEMRAETAACVKPDGKDL